jgi:hypothetical protein
MPAQQHVLLQDLDRLQEDYNIHREKIYDKFASMIEGATDAAINEAAADKLWLTDKKLPKSKPKPEGYVDGSSCPVCYEVSPFMIKIKDTCLALHKALDANLSKKEVYEILSRIMTMFTEKLPDSFRSVEAKSLSPHGKQHIVGDVIFLIAKVRCVYPFYLLFSTLM